MDSSSLQENDAPGGEDLIRLVVSLTGLPVDSVKEELEGLLQSMGCLPGDVNMDRLRSAMLAYLDTFQGSPSGSPDLDEADQDLLFPV